MSALLKRKIKKLEHEIEIVPKALGSEVIQQERVKDIEELRRELERELTMKRVVLFGTQHPHQKEGHDKNSELEQRLSFLIQTFAVTLILEEWASDCPPSFTSVLANNKEIRYESVGTPPTAQFQTFSNASISFLGHDGTLGPCGGAPPFHEYGPLDKQENRENQMVQNIQAQMNSHRVGLFIVGLAHLHSISAKLKEVNFNVAAYYWI